MRGAAGFFFDKGIFFFGKHVEGVVERAGADAISPGFARSAQLRAFAEQMGDDMEDSAIGFADPFSEGIFSQDESGEEILASNY